jgi:hypothetical protein
MDNKHRDHIMQKPGKDTLVNKTLTAHKTQLTKITHNAI